MATTLSGAVGTHVVDNVSWILDSCIKSVNSTLHILVKERPEEVEGSETLSLQHH